MAKLKKCPHCKGMHRLQKAYLRCKAKNVKETWGK